MADKFYLLRTYYDSDDNFDFDPYDTEGEAKKSATDERRADEVIIYRCSENVLTPTISWDRKKQTWSDIDG